jgi:hypothetical protein
MAMNVENDPRTSKVDVYGVPYNVRLRKIREASGLSHEDIAASANIPLSNYYDLESHEGELNRNISLGELSKLAYTLGINSRFIFDDNETMRLVSLEQLVAEIKTYLTRNNMTLAQFESRVGFFVNAAINNPSEILDWNVDCLRFVCLEIAVNWLDVLPIQV